MKSIKSYYSFRGLKLISPKVRIILVKETRHSLWIFQFFRKLCRELEFHITANTPFVNIKIRESVSLAVATQYRVVVQLLPTHFKSTSVNDIVHIGKKNPRVPGISSREFLMVDFSSNI